MSSLEKLKELRNQLCQKKRESETAKDCKAQVVEELAALHKEMSTDNNVSNEYTSRVLELLNTLKGPQHNTSGVKNV